MTSYKHCQLKKGATTQVAYVPLQYAVVGKFLRLKNEVTGEWENGWQVVVAHPVVRSEEYVLAHQNDHRTQRSASDI